MLWQDRLRLSSGSLEGSDLKRFRNQSCSLSYRAAGQDLFHRPLGWAVQDDSTPFTPSTDQGYASGGGTEGDQGPSPKSRPFPKLGAGHLHWACSVLRARVGLLSGSRFSESACFPQGSPRCCHGRLLVPLSAHGVLGFVFTGTVATSRRRLGRSNFHFLFFDSCVTLVGIFGCSYVRGDVEPGAGSSEGLPYSG